MHRGDLHGSLVALQADEVGVGVYEETLAAAEHDLAAFQDKVAGDDGLLGGQECLHFFGLYQGILRVALGVALCFGLGFGFLAGLFFGLLVGGLCLDRAYGEK